CFFPNPNTAVVEIDKWRNRGFLFFVFGGICYPYL
ncbi:MAG: hypothetical protein ACI9YL_001353, partial [Luteibaculaceae bacterium]